MGRKSPNYHVDVDRKSESYRAGSVTSSELSEVSSLGKKSNAPKIVAVVIVSLAIVAILVGVTVYLIDAEKEKQKVEREERIEEGIETEIDFGENAKAYIAEEFDTTEKMLDLSGKSDIYESLNRKLSKDQLEHLKQISQRRRFLENFQKSKQEEFLRPTQEETEIISKLIANRRPIMASIANNRMKPDQDLEFGGVGLFGNKPPHAVMADSDNDDYKINEPENDINEDRTEEMINYRDDADPAHEEIYDMSSYIAQDQPMKTRRPGFGGHPRRKFRNRNNLLRLGLEGFRRNEPVEVDVDGAQAKVDILPSSGTLTNNDEDTRPVMSRGHVAGPGNGDLSPGLATIDRRPGRPGFHHQGPIGGGPRPFARRRFRNPSGMQNINQGLDTSRDRDQMATESFQRKMLMEMTNKKQDEILSNFDSFLKIAGSELGFLRNVAKNITQSGKEVNLWEVLNAVNETVRKNPDSSIAQLMTKFEDKYLTDGASKTSHPAQAVYERSLSSLLFLSMGIFLLNSVNELVDSGNLPNANAGQARSMPTNTALENLAHDSLRHREMFDLFNSTAFDFFAHDETATNMLEMLKPDSPDSTVHNYVRLVMNLMNAYMKDSTEFECIYAAYCYELNQQAKLEGMASSVAKINSVGLRLALKDLSSSDTVPALLQSLWSWQDLDCNTMFPTCDIGFTKVEKN